MTHLQSVRAMGGNRLHWVVVGPAGIAAEWDAEIINEKQNELIAWRSLPGSQVDTAGSVHFQRMPDGRGTEVKVNLKYNPPAGSFGAALARVFGPAPENQIEEDLQHFKQIMETGAGVPMTGQPAGQRRF